MKSIIAAGMFVVGLILMFVPDSSGEYSVIVGTVWIVGAIILAWMPKEKKEKEE